ncbi:hypothetical protein D3273_21765 [Lichenibacterium minor]|uniref:Uncharacterized protein n=1 Tax=Lichenibacterium minor TaxID=2316528 RepID=A0A4Q2U0F7_9HYPH|nr:hypothetical protein [Lichenibacterium minor]RYC29903.1 hypothetical protein D3273_21765 [Lichenibacterium minor]
MSAASQDQRLKRATVGGDRTTAGGSSPEAVAAELRDLVHQAAGGVAGKTVAAQVRQAARHLGYPAESWRVREAWYGRGGGWSAAAVDDLRGRFTAWRKYEAAVTATGSSSLAQRVGEIRRLLTELERQIAGLEAEVAGMHGRGSSSDA